MKQGLDQVHTKALLEFLEKRQLNPIDALRILSISSLSILGSYVEYQLNPEEKTMLSADIDSFSIRLRELVNQPEEDLFSILLSVQMLNRELVQNATQMVENVKETLKNGQ